MLKDTSWMKPHYLAIFFCAKSIKQPSCGLLIEDFSFGWLMNERSGILYSWMNEKWIAQKMNSLLQLYIIEIEQCLFIYKKETGKSKLSMNNWPCHDLPTRQSWGFVTNFYALSRILCALSPNHNIHRRKLFTSNEQCVLWSQKVWKCIFQQSRGPNFKKF